MRWGREGTRQQSPFICLQSTQAAHPNATWRSWEEAAPWEGAVSVSSSLFLIIIQLTSLVEESRDEIGSVFSESILLWGSCLEVNSATSNNKDCLKPKGGAGQMGINRMSGCSWGVKCLVLQLLHGFFFYPFINFFTSENCQTKQCSSNFCQGIRVHKKLEIHQTWSSLYSGRMCVLPTCFLDTSQYCGNNQGSRSWFQHREFTTVHKALLWQITGCEVNLQFKFDKHYCDLWYSAWLCIFLSFHSWWGIRYKTYRPGCAWQWRCLAFCSQERLSSLAWEESSDKGTSFWSLPQPLFLLLP